MQFQNHAGQTRSLGQPQLSNPSDLPCLSMSPNEFGEVPNTIGCKILLGTVCWRQLQSDGAIYNRRAINHSNCVWFAGVATLIGSHLTREPTPSPVLTKWPLWELMLATNFGSPLQMVTKVGSQILATKFGFVPDCYSCSKMRLKEINCVINSLRPRQNGRRFADDTFKRIFLNENVRISIKISLKFIPKGPINNIPALVQIMAWPRPGDKPLSEPMIICLLTHICVTRPQWVNTAAGPGMQCLADQHIVSMG